LAAYIHRFSASNSHVLAAFGMTPSYMREQRRGFSTFEFQFGTASALRPAAQVVVRSGLLHVGTSSLRLFHVMSDARTGAEVATPDVVLLAGVNVKQAAFIERWMLGVPVTPVAHDEPARSPLDRTLLEHLRAAQIDVRRDLDYTLYALYRTTTTDLRHAVVLVGRFDPDAINGYLARDLHGAARDVGGRLSHELTMISPLDCRPAGTWMVTVDRSFILIADPASHAVML